MTGYGHTPLFGAFVTPSNDPPQRPVELAVAAERAGFDLVTFQDHPYQARFHDTWTLMAYVAARTSRIRIAGNVLNLPLRQPAVLARSAISLDLLSQGRFEMALGAGGDRCASTATITGWSAPSAAPHPPTRSASGSADTSPGCWS